MKHEFGVDIEAASRAERRRREARSVALQERLRRAQQDASVLIEHVARHHPLRIYQWGSLVHPERFSAISDIDIAVEGLEGGEEAMMRIRDEADSLTSFHVDLVQLERLDPGRADLIRRFGRVAWERTADG